MSLQELHAARADWYRACLAGDVQRLKRWTESKPLEVPTLGTQKCLRSPS